MVIGIFIIIASAIIALVSAEMDNNTLITISIASGIAGIFVMIAAGVTQGEETVSTIRTNDVLVSSVLLKTCKSVEFTVKTTVYPKWTNRAAVKDTLSVKIVDEWYIHNNIHDSYINVLHKFYEGW